jgi:hypothetical protein
MDNILRQNIINILGINALPQEQQEEALIRIGNIIFQGVLARVLELMSESDRNEFEKLLAEKGSEPEVVLNFLRSRISNLDALVNEEVAGFKEESADFMKNIGT